MVTWFTKNKSLKILSLFIAVILFLFVRGQRVFEVSKTAKIKIMSPPNMMVIGASERFIDVTLRVPNAFFSRAPTEKELQGEIDATNQSIGKFRIRISRENFPSLDKRIQVLVHEPWMEIELDKVIAKSILLKPQLIGDLKSGLSVEKVTIDPEQVEVLGPQRELNALKFLSTGPVDLTGIDKDFSLITNVAISPNSSLKVSKDKINVHIKVGTEQLVKMFRYVPVEIFKRAKFRTEIRPAHLDIEVTGENSVMNRLEPSDVRAFVDVEELQSGWQEVKVDVKVPEKVRVTKIIPDTVAVYVGK